MKVRVEQDGEHCDVVVEIGGKEAGRYRCDGDPEQERRRIEAIYRQAAAEEVLRDSKLWYGS